MSEYVQFDSDQQGMPSPAMRYAASRPAGFNQQSQSGMAGWLVRQGLISGESSAKAVLVGIVCFNFIAAAVIIYFFVLH